MQLSTFYNVLLQLLDSLKVIGVIFLGALKVKEASFLFLCVMIFFCVVIIGLKNVNLNNLSL